VLRFRSVEFKTRLDFEESNERSASARRAVCSPRGRVECASVRMFDFSTRSSKRNPKTAARESCHNQLTCNGFWKWVPNGPSEQPQRNPDVRERFRASGPKLKVHSRPRKTADLLGFSGPIIGQRECRPRASWRREAHSPRTLFSLGFDTRSSW
jgi:hypothetical protein